jgi:hypothetical protein
LNVIGLADLDGDGRLDMVVVDSTGPEVYMSQCM